AGTYGVTVTDANGCSISKNVLVPVIEKPQLTVLNTEKANCNNRGGEAVAFVSRGTPPYSYLWSDGQNSSYLLDVSAGVYTVTVTDAIGCTAIQSVTIPIKTLDTPGTITISNVAATSATLRWNDTGAEQYRVEYRAGSQIGWLYYGDVTTPSVTMIGLVAGTAHQVRIIAYCGNTSSSPSPIARFTTATNTNPCIGFAFDTAPVTSPIYYPCDTRPYEAPVIGGTAPYKYKWSNGSTNNYIQNVPAGTYGVTVTDAKGCSISKNVIVPLIEKPVLTIGTIKAATCNKLDGEASISASKGTPPYNYEWSNWTYNAKLTGVSAGTYQVTVTDDKGCYTSITVNIPTAPLATPSGVSISNITTSSATVSWNNANAEQYKVEYRVGTQATWSLYSYASTPSIIMNGLVPGNTYSVRITALCGSTSSASSAIKSFTTLTTNKPPTVAITAPANNATYNAPATVNVTATASDPDGTISKVEFYLNNTLVSTDNAPSYNATLSNLAAGTYTLTAKAFDDMQASATSSVITIKVNTNGGGGSVTDNNVLVLNGTSDYKESPTFSSYQTIKSFTLETWVKFNNPGVGTNDFIAEVGNANYTKLWFWYNNDNTFGLPSKNIAIGYNGAQGGFNNGPDFMYDFSPQAGTWYHLAFSYNNSTRQITLYINGASRGSRTVTGNAPEININNLKLYLGKRIFGGVNSHFFDGQMDDFRMWNYARSASEITNNYKTELTGKESGLIAYYKFDETSAGMNKDCSANQLHLTAGSSRAPIISNVPSLVDVACGANFSGEESFRIIESDHNELNFEGITVYPNPTSGILNVSIINPISIPTEWIIQDVTGKILYIEKRGMDSKRKYDDFTIDISHLNGGLYFLSTIINEKRIIRKIILSQKN
ncbi:MAG: LamG-like jellyroll fold domain-containing protein, partial [Saprospiraceae bacterium]